MPYSLTRINGLQVVVSISLSTTLVSVSEYGFLISSNPLNPILFSIRLKRR
nr:MAG TPA: hypothetical protein [Caudoviricetes sp.]